MKELFVRCLMIGLFTASLSAMPLELFHTGPVKPVYARYTKPCQVPEPATLTYLGIGVAAVGGYFFFRKRGGK